MRLTRLFALGTVAAALAGPAFIGGCSSDDDEDTGSSSGQATLQDCKDIVTACHHKDTMGEIECHADAHAAEDTGDYTACANKEACISQCEALEGHGGTGGGHSHSGGTGGHEGGTGGTEGGW